MSGLDERVINKTSALIGIDAISSDSCEINASTYDWTSLRWSSSKTGVRCDFSMTTDVISIAGTSLRNDSWLQSSSADMILSTASRMLIETADEKDLDASKTDKVGAMIATTALANNGTMAVL